LRAWVDGGDTQPIHLPLGRLKVEIMKVIQSRATSCSGSLQSCRTMPLGRWTGAIYRATGHSRFVTRSGCNNSVCGAVPMLRVLQLWTA